MQILRIVLDNFTTICLSIGLGVIIITNKNFDKKTNISFIMFVMVVITLVISNITDQWCAMSSKPSALRYITSSLGYTLRPMSILILLSIFLRRSKTRFVLWIPIICIALISSTSAFTHLMFWFDNNNAFMRGPLTYISHIGSLAYIIILLYFIIKKHQYITISEKFTVLFSSFICILGTIFETLMSDYLIFVTGAMATSCALYYIVLYVETFKVDQLTGLLNRRSLYLNQSSKKHKQFSVISVDLNCLKEINDSQGHAAGDKALKYLSDVLLLNSKEMFCPYRVGGDEFIIIGKEPSEDMILSYIENIRADLKKNNYMASFGYAIYNDGDDFDNICNMADKKMYEDKKRYKGRNVLN